MVGKDLDSIVPGSQATVVIGSLTVIDATVTVEGRNRITLELAGSVPDDLGAVISLERVHQVYDFGFADGGGSFSDGGSGGTARRLAPNATGGRPTGARELAVDCSGPLVEGQAVAVVIGVVRGGACRRFGAPQARHASLTPGVRRTCAVLRGRPCLVCGMALQFVGVAPCSMASAT